MRWRLLLLFLLLASASAARLPLPYVEYLEAHKAGDAMALERLAEEDGYVQILAARALARLQSLSDAKRLDYALQAAEFDNAAADWLLAARLRQRLGRNGVVEAYARALPLDEAREALLVFAARGDEEAIAALYRDGDYEELLDVLPEEAVSWRARSLYRLGRYEEALPWYQVWAGREEAGRWGLARTLLKLGDYDLAAKIYRSLPGPAARTGLGEALEAAGRLEEAAAAYAAGDAVGQWRAAGIYEKKGRLEDALKLYRQLARGESLYADDATLRLWVLARRRGDVGLEEWAYNRLDGGLAVLIGKPLEGVPRYDRGRFYAETLEGYLGLRRVTELLAAGKVDWALGAARWWVREVDAGRQREKLRYLIAREIGQYGRWDWALRIVPDHPRTNFVPYWRVAYPRAYEREVLAAARTFGLEPEVLWAVMRVESRFDPKAVSPTGARGLMQFTAATWAEVAKKLGPADPFDPGAAIRYGAYYLARQLRACDGLLVCALSSYNGGPGYTRRALEAVGGDVWDFMRFQPRDEPREYVERVLWAYAVYKELYR